MKFVFVCVFLMLVAMSTEAKKKCPTGRPECACPLIYDPVCSTWGCTYGNKCQMNCADQNFAYEGECKN